jgi:hypothetical protein
MHWLTDLMRTGDWRSLAGWLVRHNEFLAPSMAAFADDMQLLPYQPTPKQLRLLVSLRGGVEALMAMGDIIESATDAAYADAAMADDDASADEGAKVLAGILRRAPPCIGAPETGASNAPSATGPHRCGWRGKSGRRQPCRAYVQHGTDRCWHHQHDHTMRMH